MRIPAPTLAVLSVRSSTSTWEERGLFKPTTEPRDLSHFEEPLYKLFNVREPALA